MSKTTAIAIIDQKLIDRSVEFINETVRKTMYKGSLEIGEYLLINFFNDDIEYACSKDPRKPDSFQELCKRPDLGVHPSTLSRMVRVASQERYFIQNSQNTEGLSYSHKLEFIKLSNTQEKLQLVEKCIQGKMSSRQLAENVFEIRTKEREEIEPTPLKLISSVDKSIDEKKLQSLSAKPEKGKRQRTKGRGKEKDASW